MRLTEQRRIILEELKKHVDHPGADELYHEARKLIPRISLGTVYRNLELLSESGVIQKLKYGNGQKRFDPNPQPHCHFRCAKCGSIEDLPFELKTPEMDGNHPWVKARKIFGANLEYFGLCAKCSKKP